MTPTSPDPRVRAAIDVVARLADLVLREGHEGVPWYRRFREMGAVLSETDRPARDRLQDAADLLDAMYVGGRNFADFHIYRQDAATRIAENRKLSHLVDELRALVGTREQRSGQAT